MIKIKTGSPSLAKFLRQGGTWNEWRHAHTNYDDICNRLLKVEGKGGNQYAKLVREFAKSVAGEIAKSNRTSLEQFVGWCQAKQLIAA